MAVQVSYPGVYIEELAPSAPIQGVGTSTAAFVGVALKGPLDEPTKITSWDAFQQTFGEEPRGGFFLWYAVRGFFKNGGAVCYVVRASNGTRGEVVILNKAEKDMAIIAARQPGNPSMTLEVVSNPYFPASEGLAVFQPIAVLTADPEPGGKELTFSEDHAGQFRPGDRIFCVRTQDEVTVVRVTGKVVQIGEALIGAPQTNDEFRLANVDAGERAVRLFYAPGSSNTAIPQGWLQQGSVLSFVQGTETHVHVVESVQTQYLMNGDVTYGVTLRTGFISQLDLDPSLSWEVSSNELDLEVTLGTSTTTYPHLSFDSAHPDFWEAVIVNDPAGLVRVEPLSPPPFEALPDALPKDDTYTLNAGDPEALEDLAAIDFIEAIRTLEDIDDVNLLSVPDCIALKDGSGFLDRAAVSAVQQEMIGHCERLADRFAVVDPESGLKLYATGDEKSIEERRRELDSTRGYAALYYPWLSVAPFGSGSPILVPPSGHVCGVFSRSDQKRGVHKAPANEILSGALGIARTMSNIDQGQLNLQGINVIRVLAGGRPTLWGARTTATDTNWRL